MLVLPLFLALLLWPGPQPRSTAQDGKSRIASLKKILPPKEAHAPQCADPGRGSKGKNGKYARVDTLTDLLKNRVDKAEYQSVTIREILSLPWSDLATRRYEWSRPDSTKVAKYEAAPIEIEGYLVGIREEGKEGTNCEIDAPAWHDWHLWLVRTEDEAHAKDKTKAVVLEITPRVRAENDGSFDKDQIEKWAHSGQKVRVDGWLLLDPDHPNEVGQSRGTTWEVHPVMKIGPAN